MGLSNNIKNIKGILTVQIEGFFTERFINLCKINNVKIWDIRNVVKGVVRFKINISEFKKLRPIARKTKCSVQIKKKEGLYFTIFKYRKRKIIVLLIAMAIFFTIAFSTFIWNINVEGNDSIDNNEILENLKNSGLYIGKCKIGLDKKEIVNNLRVNMPDISWAGIEIDGTLATLRVVEKTNLDEKDIQNDKIGDIIADKEGVITRIVPENGTAMLNENSYVEKDNILIQGTMYSKFLEPFDVPAKGIIKADCSYVFENAYTYNAINKNYTGKTRYTIGIGINSKENMLNYLNKSKKYDITKSSKLLNIFGKQISFDLYKCVEYEEEEIKRSKEELISYSNKDIEEYLNKEILPNTRDGKLVDKKTEVFDIEDGIKVKTTYIVNESIGKYVERTSITRNEQNTD